MNSEKIKSKTRNTGILMLLIASFIWGTAFVAQSVGMDYIGPYTFNAVRFPIGGFFLIPVISFIKKINKKEFELMTDTERHGRVRASLQGGICCGLILIIAGSLQQIGIMYTTVGKAGFITTLYIILVPVTGMLFGRIPGIKIWTGAVLSLIGMYLLCINESFGIAKGDLFILLCALGFTAHILVIDYFSPKADGVLMSCVQFFTAGALALPLMLILEKPQLSDILAAWKPLVYTGVLSAGVAYTLQIIGQKHVKPAIASMVMSLESVFSVLAGWAVLGERLSLKELTGCALVFAAIIIAQLPEKEEQTG